MNIPVLPGEVEDLKTSLEHLNLFNLLDEIALRFNPPPWISKYDLP